MGLPPWVLPFRVIPHVDTFCQEFLKGKEPGVKVHEPVRLCPALLLDPWIFYFPLLACYNLSLSYRLMTPSSISPSSLQRVLLLP